MTKSNAASEQLEFSPHMREAFIRAEELIRKTYGDSPPAETLMRMWLLSATSLAVLEGFEEAVMETSERPAAPAPAESTQGSPLTL